MPTHSRYGTRLGRPRKAPGTRERDIQDRAAALVTFDHFCAQQEVRLMKTSLDYAESTNWNLDPETIAVLYRTERLGTYFNGLDRWDNRVQMEIRN